MIREMQIKTTVRYHLSPVRMANTNSSGNNRFGEDVVKEDLFCIVGGRTSWCSHSGKQYGGSSKTKNRTPLWPSNGTTRYLSTGYRCAVSKGHMHPNVYSRTINNSQSMERAQMSTDGWMDKENIYTYIHTMEYYSAIKKNEILPFATTWMELEGIMLSEISQRKTNIIWLNSYEDHKRQNRWT